MVVVQNEERSNEDAWSGAYVSRIVNETASGQPVAHWSTYFIRPEWHRQEGQLVRASDVSPLHEFVILRSIRIVVLCLKHIIA